jgi:undecaprenyl-phosphate 4-deoxy-4-formamido-L-arabinose transferase
MTSLSVVIPVYNGEPNLRDLHTELTQELEQINQPYEILFVEDCGGDRSWDIIQELSAKDQHVRGIKLSRNYGQHNALLCGIRAARFDVIVTMDDDRQHPANQIEPLLDRLEEGFDVVYGSPQKQQHGLLRNAASSLTKIALQGAMGVETARNVSAFRAFRARLRDGFQQYSSPFVSIDVLLTWTTTRFSAVQVEHRQRVAGESNYTLRKLATHAFNLLTGFSALPLQIASLLGFIFTAFGLVILAWVLIRYLVEGSTVPGFPFLASIIAIFSGAQMFALGIFGEYLARMHFRSMEKPTYVVREVSTTSNDATAAESPSE